MAKPLTEAPSRNRLGYYNTPHGRFLSVTTILEHGVPKPALPHWAAREVAQCAVDNLPRLARVRGRSAREEAFTWLRNAAETKKKDAAALGGAVHNAIEAIVLGEPAQEPTEEEAPFVDAFHRFVAEHRPVWEATELVVAHPEDGWAGTADWWAVLPRIGRVVVLGDNKTGKGVYDDAGLQMSAYRRATVGWLRDGTEVEPPRADQAVVLHLRPDKYPDTGYRLYPMDTGDDVYAAFRHAQGVAHYKKTVAKSVVGDPIELVDDEEFVHYDGEVA
ncbi:hypothetical protein [Actinokineospora globicatena]|uniref:Uncharacterized protein n=1 Tax=Actinokineospora globicatena TaxID=103729 RepID=A0A9W6V7Y7_9PSEU|nr:hypothetical protein [Actinokineospora globicatena]GLW91817.1 hypothetical protein Aglo03_26330 [Actinokineospora globicatena]